jgi:hypothetical protein
VPDACAIGDDLAAREVALPLAASAYDPSDPMGKRFPAPKDASKDGRRS